MNLQDLPYWGQLLVVVGLCAVFGFIFYQFFYVNEVQRFTALGQQLETINEEIRKYGPEEARRDELEAEIERIKLDLSQLERVFPSEKSDVRVKRFVETIAREFDIAIDGYKAGERNESEHYNEQAVNIDSRGRTIDYMRFFDALVRKDLVVHIYNMSMQKTAQSKMEGDRYPVTAKFMVSSYVYRPLEEQ